MKLELSREELISVAAALQDSIDRKRALLVFDSREWNESEREMLRHSRDRLSAVKERIDALLSRPRHMNGGEEE